jgi:formylmethanofuran dehydrogenase subunit E
MGLPLPKQHPDIRHEERMKMRPWRTFYLRTCDNCHKEIVSIYPADDTRRIYCEECYTKEVYG